MLVGASGAGKTSLALQFPKPVVIDLENGTNLYAGRYKFDVIRSSNAEEVDDALAWLASNRHSYQTLVIDSLTVYCESKAAKWNEIFLSRNAGGKGFKHEFYENQPRDWNTIKSDLKESCRGLVGLDMNIVAPTRIKPKYGSGADMKIVGEVPDCDKVCLPYFDFVVNLYRGPKGEFLASASPDAWFAERKNRDYRLPQGEFPVTIDAFSAACGVEDFTRDAVIDPILSDEQRSEIITLVGLLGLPSGAINKAIRARGVTSLDALTESKATEIIAAMKAKLPKMGEEVKTDAAS